jgi:hypothetical protein
MLDRTYLVYSRPLHWLSKDTFKLYETVKGRGVNKVSHEVFYLLNSDFNSLGNKMSFLGIRSDFKAELPLLAYACGKCVCFEDHRYLLTGNLGQSKVHCFKPR